jgi:hypothetical protein
MILEHQSSIINFVLGAGFYTILEMGILGVAFER